MFLQPTQSIVVANFPNPMPVSGTVAVSNFPATQPITGTVDRAWALTPDTDTVNVEGAVAVSQDSSPWVTQDNRLPPALGQAVSAGSLPVVLASDETVPVSLQVLPLPPGAMLDTTGQALLSALNDIAWNTTLAYEEGAMLK